MITTKKYVKQITNITGYYISLGFIVSSVMIFWDTIFIFQQPCRLSTKGKISQVDKLSDENLKVNFWCPGESISCDHFESRLKERTYTSYEKKTSDQYVEGCIFIDHMSGYIHVEHQLGFSSWETIHGTFNFEQLSLDNWVLIQSYLADNSIFKSIDFVRHIRQHHQRIKYCGLNAHNKNGIIEQNISTISNMARSILLHSSYKWKNGIDSSLWPMAVNYACYIFNHIPNK